MAKRSQYPMVLLTSFCICGVLYAAVAVMGYLMFGESTESQFTLNLPTNLVASKIAVWTTVVNPFTKFISDIAAKLGNIFSLVPYVIVVGVCKILAMIAMLPLVQLFFFHILLIQKGISTYDYIISFREQGQGISGQQSPQMSPASSFNNFRHGSWCTPPRLFVEDQCPTQPGSSECGYYVLNFMKEVVREGIQILVNDNVGGGKGIYTDTDLDTVREEWSSYASQFIFR